MFISSFLHNRNNSTNGTSASVQENYTLEKGIYLEPMSVYIHSKLLFSGVDRGCFGYSSTPFMPDAASKHVLLVSGSELT